LVVVVVEVLEVVVVELVLELDEELEVDEELDEEEELVVELELVVDDEVELCVELELELEVVVLLTGGLYGGNVDLVAPQIQPAAVLTLVGNGCFFSQHLWALVAASQLTLTQRSPSAAQALMHPSKSNPSRTFRLPPL
jgi:hypothetical protein